MEKAGDIEDTGNRENKKLGDAKPIWPRDRRKENNVRSFAIVIFYSLEYILCWFNYLVSHVASFRFLLQFSAVMLFGIGFYGVTIDIEKRQIEKACAPSDAPPILPEHLDMDRQTLLKGLAIRPIDRLVCGRALE